MLIKDRIFKTPDFRITEISKHNGSIIKNNAIHYKYSKSKFEDNC